MHAVMLAVSFYGQLALWALLAGGFGWMAIKVIRSATRGAAKADAAAQARARAHARAQARTAAH